MKLIKKLFIVIILLIVVLFSSNARAFENDEKYYTNSHNVSLTKEEYDFISMFYFDGYQKYMTQEDYNYIVDNKLMDGEIQIVEMIDNDEISPFANTSHTTNSKKLKLSSSCDSTCSMTITLNWLVSPNVRSYDLVGAYSITSNALTFTSSRILYDEVEKSYVENRKEANGISATMKLPTSGEDILIVMRFTAKKGTTVYAGYQHAKKSISLLNSRKYSFAASGYGGVFRFEESVLDYYDAMAGVKLTL